MLTVEEERLVDVSADAGRRGHHVSRTDHHRVRVLGDSVATGAVHAGRDAWRSGLVVRGHADRTARVLVRLARRRGKRRGGGDGEKPDPAHHTGAAGVRRVCGAGGRVRGSDGIHDNPVDREARAPTGVSDVLLRAGDGGVGGGSNAGSFDGGVHRPSRGCRMGTADGDWSVGLRDAVPSDAGTAADEGGQGGHDGVHADGVCAGV